jgi:ketosteroid isomerase-like protein
MKSKVLAVAVLGILGLVLLLNRQQAQANTSSVAALDNVFAALNSGELDPALASFTDDAVAENLVRTEKYRGVSEIRQMLQSMQRDGRRFDIVDAEINGDTITAKVEVSDRGIVWGSETIEAVVKGDRLQSFTVTAFRLELWRIGQ